ncbi:ABC transporter permease [Pedobacter riviphilus]|uniref:ABC transporter permease n=1 Tax=Pedobacter riviphilus TaxID=2766984 RepID=A0ABX6TNG3_9SPHI|nr:ABC transporter permease [Pedobacter riviphilus]QNR86441.1 ABC transporter permease [Pedobacter riviphilus]
MKKNVNVDIALTHIITRRRQTLIAILGVTLGVSIYLFINSLVSGFTNFSVEEMFKSSPHIKIYHDDEISTSLILPKDSAGVVAIINPQITTLSKKIVDPEALLERIKQEPYVVKAIEQVSFDLFYNRGQAQLNGSGSGVDIFEYDAMFKTGKTLVAGRLEDLQNNLNAIIIGSGIAEKLNLAIDDNITITSAFGVVKRLKIVGIFTSGVTTIDNSKSYVNISTAQQFVKKGPSFVNDIYINIPDPDKSDIYAARLRQLTSYTVEDWKAINADALSSNKTRNALMNAISLSILIVAAFGIYNILSSTISQKINDIAILKAIGFSGSNVVWIFLIEAIFMGLAGIFMGLIVGGIFIAIMSNVYMGGHIGYFPIKFESRLFASSSALGLFITICAGYFPAKKAADVDPVEIFRK